MSRAAVWRVVLDMPLRRPFDYLPPKEDPGRPVTPGVRVRVPFGRQRLIGVVTGEAASSDIPAERLKPILEVLDAEPVLDPSMLALLTWSAEYYHHPIGEVLATALPKALRLGAAAGATTRRWIASAAGRAAAAGAEPRRAPQQRRLLLHLTTSSAGGAEELAALFPGARAALRALARRGWIEPRDEAIVSAPLASAVRRDEGFALNDEQQAAVQAVSASLQHFGAYLLHGITGSGKTEVYLHLVARVLAQGRAALILVPEIGLTPQLVGRFRERFATPLAVLHSGLTDRERLDAWRYAFTGHARIVLGTRSAVFAPLRSLGLIVVDEEHDASFKQHEGGFRYSARDLAVVRAQRAAVPIVLGSATPAFETLHNAAAGRYQRLSLPRRTGQAQAPHLGLIDLRVHAVQAGISTPAIDAIRRHLGAAGQVLIFLNRRGYAPTLLCTACGWTAPCAACDARLTVHQAAGRLRCHHCGADAPLPASCPQCGFAVRPVGQGTQRVEEKLGELFPEVPCVRLDRDAVRKRGDIEAAMQRMASGDARILVGTQMVTKGHDFPNVTLVLVMNADRGLFSTDFRAPERLAQTIVQVAGRAGRGDRPGEVLIQTEFPDHPLLRALLAEGYDGFARTALREREQAAWPPYSRLAAVRDSAPSAAAALAFLTDARKLARPPVSVRLLGPVSAAMAKRAGRYHAQLLIESADRGALHRFLDGWISQIEALPSGRRVRWALDVDPLELF
ncbi:MAG TPA: primosomal protein N' [Steroidobacteraceae bacterium]|jgi:primosomal protein N' (replication factor Y)|nr:primosomal protein N' [Steroidobacteraceae bacterium]